MNRENWLIYGAYGYTGRLVVHEALAQGRRPILAGRDEEKLEKMAAELQLPFRAFEVEDAAEFLDDVGIVLNIAGPFIQTAEPIMDACLQRGVHYFDMTGEIPIFRAAHERNEAAREAGIILCPGAGFDIVPSDCLAALLKRALPEATHLELAFDFGSLPSQGTARTIIRSIGAGCLIRENGEIQKVPLGYRVRKIPFPRGELWAVSLPWGDIFTSQISTGIPNAIVYGSLPRPLCRLVRLTNPIKRWLARPIMQKMLMFFAKKFLPEGPDEATRQKTTSGFWGRVTSPDGQERTATITGPNAYAMSAELAVALAREAESYHAPGGYFTASMLVGPDFLSHREGYEVVML